MTGCVRPAPSGDALALGLRQPINRLNEAALTDDLPRIRSAARAVIATYDAAVGPR
jgi:hypothetical protein